MEKRLNAKLPIQLFDMFSLPIQRMQMLLSLSVLALSEDPSRECALNNTELSVNNNCVCVPGYVTDSSFESVGCWKCPTTCNIFSICAYPGKCVCSDGYYGDGIARCQKPTPLKPLLTDTTELNDGSKELQISFVSPPQFNVTRAFCHIGSLVVPGQKITNSTLSCVVPTGTIDGQKVFISFDSVHLSADAVSARRRIISSQISFVPFAITLLIVVLFGTILIYGRQILMQMDEERAPLMNERKEAKSPNLP